ncbi:Oxidase/peroxidase [Operophtera brumata]|uniref:Oxidase/peroxidase n=1 Tax=Operophtera brumata TaxID=104452 RepID=A0A0L7KEK0_OPEBR|nr:Oxidase/peroxidase [Operophtera brumata]
MEEIVNCTINKYGYLGRWCAIEVAKCDPHEPRRMDLSCNSLRYPTRGAYLTPYSRILPADFNGGELRTSASGRPLPPARVLRVDLMSDGRVASQDYTQMVVNYAVFVTGDITSVHDTVNYVAVTRDCCRPGREDRRCAAISVPDDDLHLRRSSVRCLNLTAPITYQDLGCVSAAVPLERINIAAPMLDLSSVYGHEAPGAAKGRLWEGGRLRAENKVIFKTLGHVDDYDPTLEPRLSIEYVTGTRWFHTIQEGRLKLVLFSICFRQRFSL